MSRTLSGIILGIIRTDLYKQIKPIQRICKYPLLLRELLKYTEKDHKDHANLIIASDKIDAVVKVANEATAVLGERDRLTYIQNKIESTPPLNLTDKKLYREGNFQFSKLSKKPTEKYLLLCGEIFAICKIVSRTKCTLEHLYSVNELFLAPTIPGSNKSKNVNIVVTGTDGILHV
jgi:hypothetical protein